VLFLLPDQRPLRASVHEPVAGYYFHDLPVQIQLVESLQVIGGMGAYRRLAREYLSDAHRVWVAYDPTQMPDHVGAFDRVLAMTHILCGNFEDSAQLHLNLYALLPLDESDEYRFGDGITAAPLRPFTITDGRLNVMLRWNLADSVPRGVYSVALHLQDSGGNLVAQSDYGLPDESDSCHSADLAVNDLPSGEYTLLVSVYDSSTGERLPATNADTGDRLRLDTIHIGN